MLYKNDCKIRNCMHRKNELHQSSGLNFMMQINFSPKRQDTESQYSVNTVYLVVYGQHYT